jgi:hypothetical protein
MLDLNAVVFSVWQTMASGGQLSPDANIVADAIVTAILSDEGKPLSGSPEGDAALQAIYAFEESGVLRYPKCFSWDCRGGVSCGVWQMPCFVVRSHDLVGQAKIWRQMFRVSLRRCPQHPGAMMVGSCWNGLPQRIAHKRWVKAKQFLRTLSEKARES